MRLVMMRGRVVPALPLIVLLSWWPGGLDARRPDQQPFRTGTNLVVVPVVVVDGKGAMVQDLTASDFRIEEDGTPVAIESFVAPRVAPDSPDQSRFIVLALDNLSTTAEIAYRVRTSPTASSTSWGRTM
jgi:hypothetical protein